MTESISSILASEARLITEASEALPHQFNTCTYSMGYIRQAAYLCLTCAVPRGICSSCSIACHTDHEQLELFPKRHFRCDCPTSALAHSCTLQKVQEDENVENVYGQNFTGKFCRCGRLYDAKKERETMIQCLACEDWFHESCLNLRERPPSREPTPELTPTSPETDGTDTNADAIDVPDDVSRAPSSDLPSPLIDDTAYDSFICRSCVLRNKTLNRWAGTSGVMMVVRNDIDATWTILNGPTADNEVDIEDNEPAEAPDESGENENQVGSKRPVGAITHSEDIRAKRLRTAAQDEAGADKLSTPVTLSTCLAPPRSRKARKILETALLDPPNFAHGAGDIFLTDGWRKRWCHCESCYPPLKEQAYLLEEEETYEPPEDPDSAFSLEELGMRALQSLPRDRALDGIRAFNEMRDDLLSYLRPFAQEGKVVGEADVRRFFEEKQEAMRERREGS